MPGASRQALICIETSLVAATPYQDVDVMMQPDDNTLTEEHALWKWGIFLDKAASEHGTPFIKTDRLKRFMVEAGFVDVKGRPFKWPTNRGPKEKNTRNLENGAA